MPILQLRIFFIYITYCPFILSSGINDDFYKNSSTSSNYGTSDSKEQLPTTFKPPIKDRIPPIKIEIRSMARKLFLMDKEREMHNRESVLSGNQISWDLTNISNTYLENLCTFLWANLVVEDLDLADTLHPRPFCDPQRLPNPSSTFHGGNRFKAYFQFIDVYPDYFIADLLRCNCKYLYPPRQKTIHLSKRHFFAAKYSDSSFIILTRKDSRTRRVLKVVEFIELKPNELNNLLQSATSGPL